MDKELLSNIEITNLTQSIAEEMRNQNLFVLRDFHVFISNKPKTDLGRNCSKLYTIIYDFITQENNFSLLSNLKPMPQWIDHALFFGQNGKTYDLEIVARQLCAAMIQQWGINIDDHVKNLSNRSLFDEIGISINKDFLIDLSDRCFEMRNQGIFFDNKILVYPHQFLRRFYSANFVGMPALLNKALNLGMSVHVRIDPLRKTLSENYREVIELDHWYGSKFSKNILKDPYLNERTVHSSRGIYCLSYDARFTIFRTKMMDHNIREFMIEEYCPIESIGSESSGAGDIFYVQKFAHACYDQRRECFTHLDGAVRVFDKDQYVNYFKEIEEGRDVDEKIGIRYKMFLVEGEFGEDLAQELLAEWFRYNAHIEEYFSGKNIEPLITYEKLREMVSRRSEFN